MLILKDLLQYFPVCFEIYINHYLQLFLIGKETLENTAVANNHIMEGYKRIKADPPKLTWNGKTFTFNVEFLQTQIDGKSRQQSSGLGGSFCMSCYCTQEESTNLDKIRMGWKIERNIDSIREYFERNKVMDEDGEYILPKTLKDRRGQTHGPLTEFDVVNDFSVLHCWIRCLYFFQRMLYRLHSGVYHWGVRGVSKTDKDKLAKGEKEFKALVRKALNIIMDMPSPHGGSSDTGKKIF